MTPANIISLTAESRSNIMAPTVGADPSREILILATCYYYFYNNKKSSKNF